MAPIDQKKISRIQSLADKLNSSSDDLNESIQALNTTLANTGIGVTVWAESLDGESRFDKSDEHDEYPDTIYSALEIGYARAHGEWQLAVRDVTYKLEPCPYGSVHPDVVYLDQGIPSPLITASRSVRMEACKHFDSLLQRIIEKAERYVKDVDAAKENVKEADAETGKVAHDDEQRPQRDIDAACEVIKKHSPKRPS